MRILGVARTLPFHSIGGMQSIAWDLFREFAKEGHEVTVLTTRIAGEPVGESMRDGVRVVALAGTSPERCNGAWWRLSAAWFEVSYRNYDAVLSISSAAASIATKRSLAPKMPFLFQAHGTSWGEVLSKWRTGRPLQIAKSVRNVYWLFKDAVIYRRFDKIVLVGDYLQRQFASLPVSLFARGVNTEVVFNGINEDEFYFSEEERIKVRESLGWSPSHKVTVYAARMHPQKGAALALRAFARLHPKENHRLLMVGPGEELRSLQDMAADLGCSSRVVFTGGVSRTALRGYLSAGDAFIFPTLRDEVGLTPNVLEALAVGLPVVCSSRVNYESDAALPIHMVDVGAIESISVELDRALECGPFRKSVLSQKYKLSHNGCKVFVAKSCHLGALFRISLK